MLLLAARRLRTQIERAVLSAPLIGLGKVGLSQGLVCPLSAALSAIGLGTASVPRFGPNASIAFEGNPLTSDATRFHRIETVLDARRDLEIDMPTIDWLAAACRAMRQVTGPDFGPAMSLPILIVAAGQDIIVSTRAAEGFARQTRSARYLEIAGSRHEILMEDDLYRDQFLAAFAAFVAEGAPQAALS